MKVITNNDIKEINRLYVNLKTYAAVARATGFSPATVKKYVIPNYQIIEEKDIKRFTGNLPEPDYSIFRTDDWGDLCSLTAQEVEEIVELWKELDV